MKHYPRMAVLTLLVCIGVGSAFGSVGHTIGIARDTDTDLVRYIEHHQYLENGEHRVRYYDAQSNILLEKALRYPGLPQHPTLTQADYGTNTRVTVERRNATAVMRRARDGETEVFSFELTPDTVIDAGFDAYIRGNWTAFDEDPRQRVRFAIAGQPRLVEMDIGKGERQDGLVSFTVNPANWLFRLMVPGITLLYDNDRKLVRYEGFSNLKPGRNDSRTVVISFDHYELESGLAAPLPEWLPVLTPADSPGE